MNGAIVISLLSFFQRFVAGVAIRWFTLSRSGDESSNDFQMNVCIFKCN